MSRKILFSFFIAPLFFHDIILKVPVSAVSICHNNNAFQVSRQYLNPIKMYVNLKVCSFCGAFFDHKFND